MFGALGAVLIAANAARVADAATLSYNVSVPPTSGMFYWYPENNVLNITDTANPKMVWAWNASVGGTQVQPGAIITGPSTKYMNYSAWDNSTWVSAPFLTTPRMTFQQIILEGSSLPFGTGPEPRTHVLQMDGGQQKFTVPGPELGYYSPVDTNEHIFGCGLDGNYFDGANYAITNIIFNVNINLAV